MDTKLHDSRSETTAIIVGVLVFICIAVIMLSRHKNGYVYKDERNVLVEIILGLLTVGNGTALICLVMVMKFSVTELPKHYWVFLVVALAW